MDTGKALGFVFEDEEWVSKILLGAVIMLFPILGALALSGYVIAVIRNVMMGDPRPLPRWENLGRYLMDGLMLWVVTLVYSLPIWILVCPIAAVWVLPMVASRNQDWVAVLAGVSGLLSAGFGCLVILYGILLALLRPVLEIRYAQTGQLRACFQFGEVFRLLFAHIGSIIIILLLTWVAGVAIGAVVSTITGVLVVIPCIGWILAPGVGLLMLPAGVWMAVFAGHLYGQIGQRAGIVPAVV